MSNLNLEQLVESLFDKQVELLSQLVAEKSTRGNEAQAQQIMKNEMASDGARIDELKVDVDKIKHLPGFSPVLINYDNMVNVIGNYGNADGTGRSLILNGHIDVVPEGPLSGWKSHPYRPEVRGNKLYGRGSNDMKAGLTAKVFALKAIREAGYMPNAPVYLQSVVEEECTGNGALACVAAGYKANAVLIGEPFDETLVTAQVGVIWFQIKLSGTPVHAERATEGVNAIEAMLPVIAAFKEMEESWNQEKTNYPDFAQHHHPINLNIAEFHGGNWTSSVPAWAVLNLRIAIYPGDSLSDRSKQIEKTLQNLIVNNELVKKADPELVYHGFYAEGYTLPKNTDVESELAMAHKGIFNSSLKRSAITAATDSRFFGIYQKTPALVYGPAGERIHAFDEYVSLDSLKNITKVYAKFIQNWCGLSKL